MGHLTLLTWVFRVAKVLPNLVKAIESRRISPNGLIRDVISEHVTLSPVGYHSIRVLFPKKHEVPFRVVRDLSALPKSIIFWIFETSFIDSLPWDPRE
jgi:hypothetical protein